MSRKLQQISTKFIYENNTHDFYNELVKTAAAIMKSDSASIQEYNSGTEELKMFACYNLTTHAREYWNIVTKKSKTSCALATAAHKRVIIPDLKNCVEVEGSDDQKELLAAGIRSVQSTPLISRDGVFIGMITTHWLKPTQPGTNALRFFDVLARQAADLLERSQQRKIIEESEQRFRSLAQTLPQLISVTDAEGNPEFNSAKWKEVAGFEPRSSHEWKEIIHPGDFDNISNARKRSLENSKHYKAEVRLKNKQGNYRWYSVTGEPVFDENKKIIKWVASFTDINTQKIREEQKDEFIGIASHEIKTPLTTASAYLQMLQEILEGKNEEAVLYTKKALQSINRLTNLTGQLLDISKIGLRKLHYNISSFNFGEMLSATVENMQLISPVHTIINTGQVETIVKGDKERLQQVIINLVSNAIKYSPSSNQVFVQATEQNSKVMLAVTDKGIGIAKESLQKIFEKYHRVNESEFQFQGMGIGLFISHEIIQRHHGKLWVESTPGEGSTFYFEIPVNSSEPIV